MPTEWLTYAAAAERLNLRPESVRQKAFRNHWPKRLGNDGFAQVQVDVVETLASVIPRPPKQPKSGLVAADRLRLDIVRVPPADAAATGPDHTAVVAMLEARIVELQTELADLRQDRERWQADVADARQERDRERLTAESERTHVEQLTGEIARLARALAELSGSAKADRRWAWVDRLISRSVAA